MHQENEGDDHVNLEPKPPFDGLLEHHRRTDEHGYPLAQIVPDDQACCTRGRPPRWQ